ncbi:MAG: amidohydrolase [Actinomycetota bacterium]|jgi:amidohydrolase|nr:amidohydrolase [Actinomycetota bacterium]
MSSPEPPASGPITSGDVATAAKHVARRAVERARDDLLALSHQIHGHPETSFEERDAAAWTAGALERAGFRVTAGVGGLATAFDAAFGSGDLVIAVCAEYDALPGVGHACGHNIIAASAVGAGLALAAVADDIGITVRVVGTPAEEGGGGKITLLDHGVFTGVHAAMMVHPWPDDRVTAQCLAVAHFDTHFTGRSAHASAAPFEGVNAADAAVVAQVAIGLLRQQLPPGDQVHGIVTHGGDAANIVPAAVTLRSMCRSRTIDGLARLEPRVRACFEAGATATGASVAFERLAPNYSHMETDAGLATAYRANAESLGRRFPHDDDGTTPPSLSTDMANVSLAVPTIHPLLGIDAAGAVNHQPEFAGACVTASGDLAVTDGAIALAWTAVDAATRPELRERLAGTG